jgi:phosphate transport system substrate-binding protein
MKIGEGWKWLLLPMVAALLVATFLLAGCSSNITGTITENGSTTVQPLAEKLAAAFKAKNPDVNVVIQGGGSAVGIKSVNDRTVDIGAASRELTSSDPTLVKHLLARDGIAIIVPPSNPITNLVGGTNKAIDVVAREEGSGTRTAFQDLVMGKALIKADAILQNSNGALKTAVSNDPQAIGFLSLGYIDSSIKALEMNGVPATEENAKNGTYPIVRPLYFLTKTQPTGIVKDFIDFCTGPDGQKIVAQEGYITTK